MSDDTDIAFVLNYGGKFECINGKTFYLGGKIHFLHIEATSLFRGINEAEIVDMYRQRIWYKLPYEDMNQMKLLCDGSANFSSMCNAAKWTKQVEIYLELQDDETEVTDHDEAEGNENNEAEDNEVGDDSENNEADGNEVGDDCDRGEVNSRLPQDERVDGIVAGFIDEEEVNPEVYRNTPPVSDDEEEENGVGYERWIRGSGELKIMQVFESIKEFKEAVLENALKEKRNVKYTRWGYEKCEAKCAVKGKKPCDWRVYCSYEESAGLYMVKTYQGHHSCTRDGFCKLMTERVIAQMFLNEIRSDPGFKPKVIQDTIEERHNVAVTHDICRKARQKALEMIAGEFDEQYSRMKDYKEQILVSNPNSTVDLVTVTTEEGVEVFDKFYVCFHALRTIWRAHCRPIFGIDGCFLKSTTTGQLLAAVGRDANNQIYPVAWGVVKVESTDTWKWFIQRLKTDLNLGDGDGFTLISDKQKGLIKAVQEELPNVEHRMCARHVYGNLKKLHPKKPELKKLFWAVADSFNMADYEAALKRVKEYDTAVYADLMARNPTTCSRAFFSTTPVCEDALNNFNESYNSGLEKARSLPLVEMLETMRRQTMVRIEMRKNKLIKYKGRYSLKVANTLAVEEKERKWLKRFPGPNGISEISEKGTSYTVNIEKKTCTCRKWDVTGIPCRHALKVFVDKKLDAEDYIDECYLASLWKMQYSDSVTPVDGMKFWKETDGTRLDPPPREAEKGRKKNPQKRKKSIHESPTKGKKASKHLKVIHCSRCGIAGHNTLACSHYGVPNKPRKVYPRKKKKKDQPTSMNIEYGGGSSQPTQTSPAFE